jgi:hypothetical protein
VNVAHRRKSEGPYIPLRTRNEIQEPAPIGQRHEQARRIALSLIGQGITPEAVFAQLRGMYEAADFPDREIENIIRWSISRDPQPCGPAYTVNGSKPQRFERKTSPPKITKEEAYQNAQRFLSGWHVTIAELQKRSPIKPSLDWREDSALILNTLYQPGEWINIVSDFVPDGGKALPVGSGITLRPGQWIRRIKRIGNPCSKAGAWIRLNPVSSRHGNGKGGAFTDQDIAAFRFLLLESDVLPIGVQLSLWSALALPIAALIDSGGRSVHCWIKVDCTDEAEYRRTATRIYGLLAQFSPDQANKNPSRFSRLPGVKREIGGAGAMEQRLFYLNSDPCRKPIRER